MAYQRNMSLTKNPMPSQDPNVRNKNFLEVATGYTAEMAMDEAKRCIQCKNPRCMGGCPVHIHIPEFIDLVAEGKFEEAYQVISKSSALPAVCGRVCPQENQCEGLCVRGVKGEPVAIGRLERFVADWHNEHNSGVVNKPESNGHKVAVVGSGPAGLTCAGDLARLGYEVTIFEALHLAGGVLVYGIPEFRLPKSIVQKEIDGLKALGVKVETNIVVGRTISIPELMEEYGFEAVFVGSGAGLPKFMNIPGENLKGVFSANEFLTRVNLMKAYQADSTTPIKVSRNVAVVGGGNVAMDAARCALRLGAEHVYIVYRRGMEELPARHEEVEHAEEEGIIFKTLTNPIEVIGDENVIAEITPYDKETIQGAKEFKITFVNPLDAAISESEGFGIENLEWCPEVYFADNVIRNNRARGTLFSTPLKTVVERNVFDHTSGTAILLCGDCNGWFETGACRDVTIRENKFINSLTNLFQFTEAVISIYPEIPNLKDQVKYFHGGEGHPGVIIENNQFETFDRPIVFAKSIDGLTFRGNKVVQNEDFPAFHSNKTRFRLLRAKNVVIENNEFSDGDASVSEE